MRLFRVEILSDHGSRIRAVYRVAKSSAFEAMSRGIEHYKMVNNGVDCRVQSITDEGPVLL